MEIKFRPTVWSFLTSLIWVMFPLSILIIFSAFNALPENHNILNFIILILTLISGFNALYWFCSTLKLNDQGLTFSNLFLNGQPTLNRFLAWKEIDEAVIETTSRFLIFNSCILSLYYDGGYLGYPLSDLSEVDKYRVIEELKSWFPDVREIDV